MVELPEKGDWFGMEGSLRLSRNEALYSAMSVRYREDSIRLTLSRCLVRIGRPGFALPVRPPRREQKTCTQWHDEFLAACEAVSTPNLLA
jgi:hypothetical protein